MKSFHVTTIKNVFQEPKDMHILKKKDAVIFMFLLSPHLSITRFHVMLWANVESHWTKQRQTQHLQHLFTHFYCFDCIMVHWLMFADVAPLALPETSNWRYLPEYIFFLSFFFLLVSFCKCLYVHLYIQKTIWNCFKMWKIFSEIKMWCNPKRRKRSVCFLS